MASPLLPLLHEARERSPLYLTEYVVALSFSASPFPLRVCYRGSLFVFSVCVDVFRGKLEAAPFTCDRDAWKPDILSPSHAFDWTNVSRLEDLAAGKGDSHLR